MISIKLISSSEFSKSNLLHNFDGCIHIPISAASYSNNHLTTTSFRHNLKHLTCVSADLVNLPESDRHDPPSPKDITLREKKTKRSIWKRFSSSRSQTIPKPISQAPSKSISEKPQNGKLGVELEDSVASVTSDTTVERCNSILKELEQCSDEETMSFFDWMRSNGKLRNNVSAFNYALRVLGRKQDWEAAEKLLREAVDDSGNRLNFQVFNTLIYACSKRGLVTLGAKWFHLMLESGVLPNVATFGMLMSLYQKGGNVVEAEFAFCQMRSLQVRCQSAYSAMITIYTRLGLFDKAEEIIGFMKDDHVIPNSENWLVRINAYSQQGKLEEAERVLMSMLEAGIPPNIVAYNTLITGYGKVSDMVSAQRVFEKLPSVGLDPDETTYRSMVEGWGRADHHDNAKWYYQELKKSGFQPNSSNMFTMLNLYARNKDEEEGTLETLEDMRRIGCQYSSMLTILVQAYEKVERLDKVPILVKGPFYEHVLVNQTSCSILVIAYVKNRLVDDALRVLQEKQWKDVGFEDNLYHLLICSCKELGFHEEVIKIFIQMPKSDANPNLHIACTMIDIYGNIGRFTEAEDLYHKLKSSVVKFDMVAYSIVVRMYVKARSLENACSVLDTMDKQTDIVPDTFLFRDMLRIYQKCGMHEKLAELYFKLLKSEIVWDQEMYNCVINCCARALPVDELTRIFDEMLERGFSPNTVTFNIVLDVYGKERLFKKARKVFWIARKRGLADVISYNTIVAAYGQSKDFANMRATVRKMEFSGFSVSLEVYNCMLDAYGKDSQMEKFRSVLQRLKESSCVSDHYTYGILINIYGEQGWIEEVTAVLSELKEYGMEPTLCSYNTLIKAYGIAGMVEEAVNVVKEMREKGVEPDHVTYINLVHALQRNDNFLEAVKWSLWMKQMGMSGAKR